MAQLFNTTITFQTSEEADQFFGSLDYRPYPSKGRRVLVANGTDDFGNPIMTFARQHFSDVLTFDLTDMERKAA